MEYKYISDHQPVLLKYPDNGCFTQLGSKDPLSSHILGK